MSEEIKVNKQSSIRIKDGKTVYFDPWDVREKGDADFIFITHDHSDHFSPGDIKKLLKNDTVLIAPEKMKNEIRISGLDVLFVEPGKEYEVNGLKFKTVPAYNLKKHFHPKSNGWCGYIVDLNGKEYYITSDTDHVKEMKDLKPDYVFIPIGGTFTMDVDEAVDAVKDIKPKVAVPIHYGTIVGSKRDGEVFKEKVEKTSPGTEVEIML